MRKTFWSYVSAVPLLLIIPYFAVILLQNVDEALQIRSCDVDNYLPFLLSRQISEDYEPETLKCQAVIARSNLWRQLKEGEKIQDCIEDEGEDLQVSKWIAAALSKTYQTAVRESEGQVLLYQGEWKLIPYHEISSGQTRSGEEVFHDCAYTYLQSVDSQADKESEEYLTSIYIPAGQLPETLTVTSRDSAGYILSLLADNNPLEGEAFREGMNLPSSDFTIQKIGEQYRFLCRGRGHGLGFSQYGGNDLAKEGKSYEEILQVYFPALELTKVNSR
jgi:stage II sporulation protein D